MLPKNLFLTVVVLSLALLVHVPALCQGQKYSMSDESPERIRHKIPPGLKIPGAFKRLLVFCGPYIQAGGGEMEPNEFCCHGIKENMSPVICEFVPPFVEQIISMKKLVYVADKCGLPLAPGTKCGSYTVPPPLPSLGA